MVPACGLGIWGVLIIAPISVIVLSAQVRLVVPLVLMAAIALPWALYKRQYRLGHDAVHDWASFLDPHDSSLPFIRH